MPDVPRLVVAAPRGRSGKTLLSSGLCAAFRARGLALQPYKRGPDYIDPGWLSAAANRTCRNLDFFLMGAEGVPAAFADGLRVAADLALIEGAMGLFDGLGPEGEGSTAHVARLLRAPILLVLDASRMTRSAAALVRGLQTFEPDTTIGGVVFNHVNHARHLQKLRAALERHCDLPVLGALPDDAALTIPQRHLGLTPQCEDERLRPTIAAARRVIETHVDLESVLKLARSAPALPDAPRTPQESQPAGGRCVPIGVAQDRAFSFYYPDNLEALQAAGAELLPFDALHDAHLPPVAGLYLGGGFPELFMDALADNASLRREIRAAVDDGLPTYAECGGLMYLARSLSWEGRTRPMVGALPCRVEMAARPQGHGYVQLQPTADNPFFPAGAEVRGHEFHHSRVEGVGDARFAYHVRRGQGVDGQHDGLMYKNVLASYTHLHTRGAPGWAERFVGMVRERC
ncbi:MAG: cobyrinate a,c-diamide synthase [Anaerolineales bacterium]